MLNFLKRPRNIVIILILVVLVGGFFYRRANQQPHYQFATVEQRDISSVVSVTGRIQPAESLELSFESGGKIQTIRVDSGTRVTRGQLLATLSNGDSAASLAQAQALVAARQATLDELRRGTRPEEVQSAETAVQNAERSLADAKTNLDNTKTQTAVSLNNLYLSTPNILSSAYALAEEAVYKQTQDLFTNDATSNPKLSFTTTNSQAQIDSEFQRQTVKKELADFRRELDTLATDTTSLDTQLRLATNRLQVVRTYLSRLTDAVNAAGSVSASTLATYKADVNTARTNNNTAIASINNQQQAITTQVATNAISLSSAQTKINDAQSTLQNAKDTLALKKAGATKGQIDAAAADLRQAQASAASASANLGKTTIHAPVAGVITKKSASVGESVAANTTVLSMITDSKLEIEANIPEVDIGRVAIGNPIALSIDAFPNEMFQAKVTFIDPAETIIDGVVNFRVKAALGEDKEDPRLKSGLTANLTIETERLSGVLALPQYAIVENNQGTFVRILENGATKDIAVALGARSQDGYVEIRSGVTKDQQVLNISAAAK